MRNKCLTVIPVLVSLCLAGCDMSAPYDTPNKPYEGQDIVMNSVPPMVQKDANMVGKAYGDPHPTVLKVIFGGTFDGKANMYRVEVNGNFIRQGKPYQTIYFSMLVDGSDIGSISDSNDLSKMTWGDDTLPVTTNSASEAVKVSISSAPGNLKMAQAVQVYLEHVSDPTVIQKITILEVTYSGKKFGKEQWTVKLDVEYQPNEASAYNQGINYRFVLYTEKNNQFVVTGLATGM